MKSLSIFLSVIILFIYFGCSGNVVSPKISSSSKSGKMVMKINGGTVPSNVTKITFVLTQNGQSTLTKSTEPSSDSSASISFNNVPTGTWQLSVSAVDSIGEILYTGNSQVLVQGGVTTQVNIKLDPYSSVTGIVDITVSWGNSNSIWTDYSGNPVFTIYQNPTNPNEVSHAKIIVENGIYKMWYQSTYNAGKWNTWYAESTDGISWKNKTETPVLDSGTQGSWDDYSIGPGAIIKDGDNYKMYYNGCQNPQYGPSSVGLAVSSDGINWEKYTSPVLAYNSTEYNVDVESVLKINGTYYMYYNSSPQNNSNNWVINLATSTDGINWERYGNNPILSTTYSWEGNGVTYPSVIYENNQFIMIYENAAQNEIGVAISSDGKNWEKNSDTPIFSYQDTNQKLVQIAYPFLMKTNGEYRIYYTANDGTDRLFINFATSDSI